MEGEDVELPVVDDDLGESREGSRTDAEAVERCVCPLLLYSHSFPFSFMPFIIHLLYMHVCCVTATDGPILLVGAK